MRFASVLLAGLCALAAACDGGSGSSTAPTSSTLSVTVPSSTMVSGTNMQASATLNGVPASGVAWTSSDRDIIAVTSSGLLTASAQGIAVITATSGTAQGRASVTVTPGAPAQVRLWSGDRQSAAAGTEVKDPLCTIVVDAQSNLIKGLVVTYTVTTGGGTIAAPTAPTTNAQGIAISGLWKLGTAKGDQTVTATYGTLPPITFTATAQ
jgi:hypothetical protein